MQGGHTGYKMLKLHIVTGRKNKQDIVKMNWLPFPKTKLGYENLWILIHSLVSFSQIWNESLPKQKIVRVMKMMSLTITRHAGRVSNFPDLPWNYRSPRFSSTTASTHRLTTISSISSQPESSLATTGASNRTGGAPDGKRCIEGEGDGTGVVLADPVPDLAGFGETMGIIYRSFSALKSRR